MGKLEEIALVPTAAKPPAPVGAKESLEILTPNPEDQRILERAAKGTGRSTRKSRS